MAKINLHLYSGLLDMRSIKTIKVLNLYFNKFYLSGIGKQNDLIKKKSKKIEQIYLSKKKNLLAWYYKNIIYFKNKNIRLINVHSVGALPLGVILKKINSSKLIYDAHELESETNHKSKINKFIAKLLETIFIKYVDHMFVVSDSISEWYKNEYSIKKPTVIYNSPILRKTLKINKFRSIFKLKKDQKIFLYQGGIGENRGIELILKSFSKRKCNKSVAIFLGSGPLEKLVKEYSRKFNNIFFHPPVRNDLLLEYTKSADFGFALLENTCLNHNYCLGNKFFEYICSGVPPIVSNLKEMKRFVKLHECGYHIKTTVNSLNNLIDKLIKTNIKNKIKNCENAAKQICWQVQEKKLKKNYKFILNEN